MNENIKEKYDKMMLLAPKEDQPISRAVFKDFLHDLLIEVSKTEFNYAYDEGLKDAFKNE